MVRRYDPARFAREPALISPSVAADLKEEIVAIEKRSWNAAASHDAKTYGDDMADDGVMVTTDGDVSTKQKALANVTSKRCTIKSFDLADTTLRQLSPDSAVLTYNLTQDVTCDGQKASAKAFATAIYVRQGGKWRWVHYQETALK